mmetsp:Transcript_87392/g.154989  ORF Transcript_87392/g.154989 Transcript_87392/m.154989 type:complete len:705 (-) Transcript_87392:95-2209(-)|eukprot:CAMPEP_0197710262 /NCGR_PEP_ID=MMETSP1338-20131121/128866_1 /TAXON_ID=43686 ORGANISM="Pelagodinium beii, Strain RCC1491" /NCGR_SAMPLE_ID=MMETSP1338 /ASSEMBLY_ACC=CAM_ASM_000754 /LENGTH=704 /DNA_ID=CAMNT_0043294195 /DNA_START=22 /DNA_END=2136 /DNA_ORIENTATION=+
MVAAVATREVSNGNVNIHPWEQFVHSFRTQVTSIHHNVSAVIAEKFGPTWRPTTAEPVWLLGRHYRVASRCEEDEGTLVEGHELYAEDYPTASSSTREGADEDSGSPEDFDAAWAQITRMTYRKGFAPMYRCVRMPNGTGSDGQRRYIRLTSDAGWGCMIRVGQMLLATALKRHHGLHEVSAEHPVECQFLDDPDAVKSPFSIFGFIRAAHGREVAVPPGDEQAARIDNSPATGGFGGRQLTQKLPGDWFGPTTISETIAALVERNKDLQDNLAVYVDSDGVLYEDEVRALAQGEEAAQKLRQAPSPSLTSTSWKPWGSDKAADESEDEFQVLTTASVSSASNVCSPLLNAVPSPYLAPAAGGEMSLSEFEEAQETGADVLQVGSFKELQADFSERQQFECDFQLPPPAVDAADLQDLSPLGVSDADQEGETTGRWKRAVLLLFPLQLGCEKYVGEDRVSAVLRYFEIQSSLGAMGGRPRMAHFFVGRQGQGLLYVDPHVVQPAVSGAEPDDGGFAGAETFRNLPTVQTIPVEHIDSSISFAFYIRCEEELVELIEALKQIETAEASAPIRVEATRPAALRQPQALCTWGDGDLVLEETAEEEDLEDDFQEGFSKPSAEAMAMPRSPVSTATPASDLCVVGEEDLSWRRADQDPPLAQHDLILSELPPAGIPETATGGRTICVPSSSWADGQWAQLNDWQVPIR